MVTKGVVWFEVNEDIIHFKLNLRHFQTKDLGKLDYILGIKVTLSRIEIFISQRKYILDKLEE